MKVNLAQREYDLHKLDPLAPPAEHELNTGTGLAKVIPILQRLGGIERDDREGRAA